MKTLYPVHCRKNKLDCRTEGVRKFYQRGHKRERNIDMYQPTVDRPSRKLPLLD